MTCENESSMERKYPKGTIWQDNSSLKDDGLVDFYVMNEKWEFSHRGISFIDTPRDLNTPKGKIWIIMESE